MKLEGVSGPYKETREQKRIRWEELSVLSLIKMI